MKNLASLNKYFVKYKWRLLLGLAFVSISNIFAVLAPVVVRNVLDRVTLNINSYHLVGSSVIKGELQDYIFQLVLLNGLLLLGLAVMRGTDRILDKPCTHYSDFSADFDYSTLPEDSKTYSAM